MGGSLVLEYKMWGYIILSFSDILQQLENGR